VRIRKINPSKNLRSLTLSGEDKAKLASLCGLFNRMPSVNLSQLAWNEFSGTVFAFELAWRVVVCYNPRVSVNLVANMKRFHSLLVASAVACIALQPLRAESLKDLEARQEKVKSIASRVMPCVVAVISADEDKPGSGSGVIVSKDGLILTAAHVTQATGNNLTIIFPDGKRVKGTALGANRTTDAGMAKITTEGEWPFVEMGQSDLMKLGDWVVAMGHPGGFSFERPPPVRLGRVWRRDLDGAFYTSCPLIGGDSGGPLFDLDGKVIGIHSSIHGSVEMNRHVAIDTLRFDWDKLIKDQIWGKVTFTASNENRPITGALFDRESQDGVLVKEIFDNLPASRAGMKAGDVITHFDGEAVTNFLAMQRFIGRRKPGDIVPVAVKRGEEHLDLTLELAGPPARSRLRNGEGKEEGEPPELREPWSPDEKSPQPYLGAVLEAAEGGAKVTHLAAESPAAKAGLQEGDILLQINTSEVNDPSGAADLWMKLKPGEKVTLTVKRGAENKKLELEPGKK
jgi:serine protease Do